MTLGLRRCTRWAEKKSVCTYSRLRHLNRNLKSESGTDEKQKEKADRGITRW